MLACFYISIYTNVLPRLVRGIQLQIHTQKPCLDAAHKARYDVCVDTYGASSWHPDNKRMLAWSIFVFLKSLVFI
jgi:hypothetical protein